MAGHLWTIEVGGVSRKFQTLKFGRKLDMNSPASFEAKIDYSSSIDFMDVVVIKRNDVAEWKGYVEDKTVEWGGTTSKVERYLTLKGRDAAFIIWKKYIEDFSNYAEKTAGFFGQVNAMELILFILRSPHSDPANTYDPSTGWNLQYPNNKEGWGLDSSKLQCAAYQTTVGDAEWTVLRRRAFGWRNTGNPYADALALVVDTGPKPFTLDHWTPTGSSPYLNNSDNSTYIKSNISYSGDESAAIFYFTDSPSNLTSINAISVELWFKTDSSIWWWDRAHFAVYLWVQSMDSWIFLFDQICGGQAVLNWTERIIDVSSVVKSKSDIDNAKLKIINISGASLSTYIGYTRLLYSYGQSGTQTIDDYFDITFPAQDIMGIYFESRMDNDSYPRNYQISTLGALEAFTGWDIVGPFPPAITLLDSDTTIRFISRQDETDYIDKNYPNGMGNFDFRFSFMISTTSPHPYAFIPFCLSENEEDYKAMVETAGHYFTALEVKSSAGSIYARARLKTLGSTDGGSTTDYVALALSTRYYVEVLRSGSMIQYRMFTDPSMNATSLIMYERLYTFDTSQEFHYRFQALTYNGLEWGTQFSNSMDDYFANGQQVGNGGFEDGDFTDWSHRCICHCYNRISTFWNLLCRVNFAWRSTMDISRFF